MNKTRIFIYGALSGFIATSFDVSFKLYFNHPIGSYILVSAVIVMASVEHYYDHKEVRKNSI